MEKFKRSLGSFAVPLLSILLAFLIGGLIMIPLSELLRANFAAILPGINMLMYAIVLIVVIRFRPSGILGWYMNSKVKTFIDEKILKKPSLDVLEEYELMADKGGK